MLAQFHFAELSFLLLVTYECLLSNLGPGSCQVQPGYAWPPNGPEKQEGRKGTWARFDSVR